MPKDSNQPTRRGFAAVLAGAAVTETIAAQSPQTHPASSANQAAPTANAIPQNTNLSKPHGMVPETPPFGETLQFTKRPSGLKVRPFALNEVTLLPSIFRDSRDANLGYLRRLNSDRLLHNFRINAGLPSSAQPLGGWEKPDCELRGHFVGHYLSACALMYAATADPTIKEKGDYIVAELSKCQARLPNGYLSAFPVEFFDRVRAREKVWAPFYTIHKIMAGMYDMHELCQNRQALAVLEGMANWVDQWSAPIPEPHMQGILDTEFGGMNEVLYNLAAVTGNDRYAVVGDRFTKKKFFNPLALQRDELRGLHANTHIPQVIGAARRYELSDDQRFRDVAEFFWWDVTEARAYATGGTSNGELWLVEPHRLGAELKKNSDTAECCCAYNMLKLTEHLYEWSADPAYFDYYERTLLNHRIAAVDRKTGATQYFLSIVSGAWKTFNTENDSFWCCTGTGVEEFSKLNGSIYHRDDDGIYVNLFVPSLVKWTSKGMQLQMTVDVAQSLSAIISVQVDAPTEAAVHVRVPYWAGVKSQVQLNGQTLPVAPSPTSYFTLRRTWNSGDRVQVILPMHLHAEAFADEPSTQAFLYGPFVLAGVLGTKGLSPETVVGLQGPDLKRFPLTAPVLNPNGRALDDWLKASAAKPLTFTAEMGEAEITFVPFHELFGERYSVYWQMA